MSRIAIAAATAALAVMIAGCAGPAEPVESPVESAPASTPTAAPSPSETAAPLVFTQPRDCLAMFPASRIESFRAQNLTLLGGPGGKFGNDYLIDPTPEESAGGITCIWGDNSNDVASLTISVAPLSPDTRPGIVADLAAQGLNTASDGPITTFGQLGDDVTSPAIINVLRADSWISVISAFGGQVFYDEAVGLTEDVAATVYVAG